MAPLFRLSPFLVSHLLSENHQQLSIPQFTLLVREQLFHFLWPLLWVWPPLEFPPLVSLPLVSPPLVFPLLFSPLPASPPLLVMAAPSFHSIHQA